MFVVDEHLIIMGLLAAVCVLATAARRFPRQRWLASFRIGPGVVPPEIQRRIDVNARANHRAQADLMIVLGLSVPFAHVFLSAMTMSDPLALERLWLPFLVMAGLIALGVWGLVAAREK